MNRRLKAAIVVAFVGVLLIGLLGQVAWADDQEPDRLFGVSFPSFGSVRYNDEGEIHRTSGLNLTLGYSSRHYTGDGGVQPNQFNSYWGWGTLVLVIPYVEFGLSYPFALGDGDQFVVIDVGLLYFIPYISFSIWY